MSHNALKYCIFKGVFVFFYVVCVCVCAPMCVCVCFGMNKCVFLCVCFIGVCVCVIGFVCVCVCHAVTPVGSTPACRTNKHTKYNISPVVTAIVNAAEKDIL